MTVALTMPVYGHAEWLRFTIPPALAALRRVGGRLVVYTDGDPESASEAERLRGSMDFDLIVGEENRGTGHGVNVGHRHSLKELGATKLGWISSDNVLHEDYCEVLSEALDTRSDYVYANYRRVSGRPGEDGIEELAIQDLGGAKPYDKDRLISETSSGWLGPAFMYTDILWLSAGEHKSCPLHDYDWWLRAEEASGFNFKFVDKKIMTYFVHKNRSSVRLRGSCTKFGLRHREEARKRRVWL